MEKAFSKWAQREPADSDVPTNLSQAKRPLGASEIDVYIVYIQIRQVMQKWQGPGLNDEEPSAPNFYDPLGSIMNLPTSSY